MSTSISVRSSESFRNSDRSSVPFRIPLLKYDVPVSSRLRWFFFADIEQRLSHLPLRRRGEEETPAQEVLSEGREDVEGTQRVCVSLVEGPLFTRREPLFLTVVTVRVFLIWTLLQTSLNDRVTH